ncbi:GAM-1 [Fowl aviadenovirus E]|uniref:GAM-1 n=1 Tax=Fowl aviadenovirus E TaxID=190065 RepID=A0A1B2TSM1_9ADEN|nr:GAM-1 [Fowl aviadenovirus E]
MEDWHRARRGGELDRYAPPPAFDSAPHRDQDSAHSAGPCPAGRGRAMPQDEEAWPGPQAPPLCSINQSYSSTWLLLFVGGTLQGEV